MPQTNPSTPIRVRTAAPRPGQDMVTARKQAGQFPSVGMTLPSYQYDPRDKHGWQPQTMVVKGRKVFKRIAIVLGILLVLVGGFIGAKFIYNAHKVFGGNIL